MITKYCLIVLFFLISIVCVYKDIKENRIPNVCILCGLCLAIIIHSFNFIIYHYDMSSLLFYLTQIMLAFFISILFYCLKVWAGGDTKLFIVLLLCVPVDFFSLKERKEIISIIIIMYVLSFVYIIIENIYFCIKKEPILSLKIEKSKKQLILNVVFSFVIITMLQGILRCVFNSLYINHYVYFYLCNVFVILLIQKVNIKDKYKIIFSVIGIIILSLRFNVKNIYHLYLTNIIIIVTIFLIRFWGNKYNYKEIEIVKLKSGMIISAFSTIFFAKSKIKGLPNNFAEDMSARITQDEVECIKKWSNTSEGLKKIWIVRKIPFSLFICISFAIFFVRGMYG